MGFGFRDVIEYDLGDLAKAYRRSLEECGTCANQGSPDCYFRNEGIPGKCEYFDLKVNLDVNSELDSLCELLVARVD